MRHLPAQSHVAASTLELIGGTPLVALDRLGEGLPGQVLLKLELANPGGSVKDRAALRCVEDAEQRGELRPGGTVVELTSGNMGIGLAIVCAIKGYRLVAVMSEGNSAERRRVLAAYGAEVILVPQAPGGLPGKVSGEDLARVEARTQELVRERDAWRPDQFHNPSNAAAHKATTGPELWAQMGGEPGTLWAFAAIVGTGGTFVGVARALKARDAAIRCIAVEPSGAQPIAGRPITAPGHKLQGAGYAGIPPTWDPSLYDGTLAVTDEEAIDVARDLARREGILTGCTGGANVAAALRLAADAPPSAAVVTIASDTGLRYLSTDLFAE
ncbi:MAG: cysteine synthase family protein [Chloroflexota bacterium]|nr:cysteine synthase family protein [Chloroflexota bacterium]